MRRLITIALWTLAWLTVARALTAPGPPHASATLPSWFGHDETAPRRIAGRLLERGVPVAGTVHLRIDAPDPSIWTGLDVEAGPDGAFDFGDVRAGEYLVLATSTDRASRVFEIDTTEAPADALSIYTAPCAPQRLRVMAGTTPIAGARVEIAGVLVATSGSDGSFAVCSTFEPTLVTIRAAGFRILSTPLRRREQWDDEVEEIGLLRYQEGEVVVIDELHAADAMPLWPRRQPLPPPPPEAAFTISGIITHHGRPLPDAVIGPRTSRGSSCGVDVFQRLDERRHEIRTRADGSFTFDIRVFGQRHRYLEISEASGLHAFRSVELLPEGSVHLTIEVADMGSIAGIVTGGGPRLSLLWFIADLPGRPPNLDRAVDAPVAADGRFTIPRLEPDRWYDVFVWDVDTGSSVTRRVYLDAAHPDLSDLVVDLADHDRPR